jgi:hypothetical protein
MKSDIDMKALATLRKGMDDSELVIVGLKRKTRIRDKAELELFIQDMGKRAKWFDFYRMLREHGLFQHDPTDDGLYKRTEELIDQRILLDVHGVATLKRRELYHSLFITKVDAFKELLRCLPKFAGLFQWPSTEYTEDGPDTLENLT